MNQTKTDEVVNFSLRLPEYLYKTIVSLAKNQKTSVNQTIKILLEQRLEYRTKQELWNEFSYLSIENQDIDYSFSAQQEIMETDV